MENNIFSLAIAFARFSDTVRTKHTWNDVKKELDDKT